MHIVVRRKSLSESPESDSGSFLSVTRRGG
jgi:hypothetical protein